MGKDGAAVYLCNGIVIDYCLFSKNSLVSFLRGITKIDKVVIEDVGSRPGQNSKAVFTFGKELGKIEGVLEVLGLTDKIVRVYPQTWCAFYSHVFTEKGKAKSQKAVKKLFGDSGHYKDISKHDGASDALLIGFYYYKINGGK